MGFFIGVDIGTTNIKSSLYDEDGKLIYKASYDIKTYHKAPGYSEQDPDEIFRKSLIAIKKMVDFAKDKAQKIEAVCFSSAMHSLIAIDKNHKPLLHCIIWSDTRSEDIAFKLFQGEGKKIYRRTGTPIHPLSPLCKILWLKKNNPEIFEKTYKFISIKEYIFLKLFGEFLVDYSIASATGLFDVYNFDWSSLALDYIGIGKDKLSYPVDTTYCLKGLQNEYAKYLDIPSDTPFVIGASDGCLSNLSVGSIYENIATVTIGTSGAIRVMSKTPVFDDSSRLFSYILKKNVYVVGAGINNGGVCLEWFFESLYSDNEDDFLSKGVNFYKDLFEIAEKSKPGSEGLIFLPYLFGERSPLWGYSAKGAFFWIDISHKREHFVRSIMEGVIFSLYNAGLLLEKRVGRIERIHANGGFSKSSLWLQILSDVFLKEVYVPKNDDSSCFGAVILGMLSLGFIDGFDKLFENMEFSMIKYPDYNNHMIYKDLYDIFESLSIKTSYEFERLKMLKQKQN